MKSTTHRLKSTKHDVFFKAGGSGVGRCLAWTFFSQKKRPFSKQGAPVWGVASQGRFCFSENDPFSFLDITFRVNGLKVHSLSSK